MLNHITPDLYMILAYIFIGITAAIIFFASLRYFELSIALTVISVWIPLAFFFNVAESEYIVEAGIGSYVRVILVMLLGAVGVIKYYQSKEEINIELPPYIILLSLFLFLTLFSTIYSIDKWITIVRSISFIAFLGFLFGFYSWLRKESDITKTLNIIFIITVIFTLLSLAGMVLIPQKTWSLRFEDRFIGIWGHPNTMGAFCMSAYPILFWKYENTNKKYFIVFLMIAILFMQVLTGSRTSLMGTALSVIVWFLVKRKYMFMVATIVAIVSITLLLMLAKPKSFSRPEEEDVLMGRDQYWLGTITLIMERPFYGYGYSVEGKIWEDPRFYKEGYELWSGSSRSSIHNGFLSIAVSLGIVGLLLWIVIITMPLFQLIKSPYNKFKPVIISTMVMVIFSNFAESNLNAANNFCTVLFWILWLIAGKVDLIYGYKNSYQLSYN